MLKRIAVTLAAILLILVLGTFTLAAVAKDAGEARVPAGMKRNEARYVTMRDGVRIAIDVWYPATLATGQKVPTLINATRYVRATKPGILAKAAVA